MTPDERKALDDYVAAVRAHYGPRLVDVLMFGSRARGDYQPDSDADIAVVLKDGDWRFWDEQMDLAGLAYDVLLEHGLFIQPWPVSLSAWGTPASSPKRHFIETIRRDARSLAGAGMNALWQKAKSDVEAAEILLTAGYPNAAVNRAYYAMFNAAKVVLAAIDPKLATAKSHASIIRRFGKHVVEERGFDRSLGRMLSKSEVAKVTADCEDESVDRTTARRILDEARRFPAAAEQFLSQIEP